MLSPMPPSTATKVRTPGISLTAPTVYTDTPAGPEMALPGSMISFGEGKP